MGTGHLFPSYIQFYEKEYHVPDHSSENWLLLDLHIG